MSTHCRPSRKQKNNVSEWSTGCISVDAPYLLSRISIIKQAKPSLFGVTVFAAPGFNPNSHHAVMFINSQEITRVDVRANCICAIMHCKMESELKYNAFPDPCVGENVVNTMRFCAFNRGIDHGAMPFLAATTTRAVSANPSVAFDTTPATLRTLAVTFPRCQL